MNRVYAYFVVVFSALFLAACGVNSNNPKSVATAYVKSVYKGDAEAVIAFIDMDNEKMKGGDKAAIKDMLSGKMKMFIAEKTKEAENKGGVKDIEAAEVNYAEDDKYANVLVKITFANDNEKENVPVSLIKTNDGWKVRI